jgi:2-keto-3-deoxy-L-rhamnonate aldolase RhmA
METANPLYGRPLASAAALKTALAGGETRIGSFVKIPSPDIVEVIAGTGLHFVVADAEHGPIDPGTCQAMARAADACGVPLLVRIGESGSPGTINRFLDTGVAGVVLPRVSSPESARTLLDLVRYPPLGSRGLAGARWARYGSAGPLARLVEEYESAFVIVIQIEEVAAIDRLDDLLEVEGPDVFFIGPTDLAASMGLRGDKSDPRVVDLIAETLERIVGAGRTAGILASTPQELADYVNLGVRFAVLNGESLVHWGAKNALDAVAGGVPA